MLTSMGGGSSPRIFISPCIECVGWFDLCQIHGSGSSSHQIHGFGSSSHQIHGFLFDLRPPSNPRRGEARVLRRITLAEAGVAAAWIREA
uniref:Uncharacterized protein n=1 Tax=Arundo donax TaxID=35708 RepID=A0A0A9DA11_ARUDO